MAKSKTPRSGNSTTFDKIDPEKARQARSKGGRTAHKRGTAHEWTADEARARGHDGGVASRLAASGGKLLMKEDTDLK